MASDSDYDSDFDSDKCAVCAKEFSLTFRRHSCHFCKRPLCQDCTQYKLHNNLACDSCSEKAWEKAQLERDTDYERLEIAMGNWPPPPCLGFMENMSVVDIRESILSKKKWRLDNVIDNPTVHSWIIYQQQEHVYCPRARFQSEDWETMGEYIMNLSNKCNRDFSWYTVLRILRYGHFVKLVPKVVIPKQYH